MAIEPRTEQRRRMEAGAEAERRPGDPTATKPPDARRIGLIIGAALLIGVVALGAMFINNTRYDGNSPVPVSEQRR
ncbi:MAG: hypothetical protein GEV13_35305 [Rhodospirillales bacterium]|nr:hypothetical protein [Rhodospirillales bacterium]